MRCAHFKSFLRLASTSAVPTLLAAGLLAVGCGGGDETSGGPGGPGRGGPGGSGGRGGFGGPGGFGAPAEATSIPVEVQRASRRDIADYIETNGTLEAENEVDVVARTSGPIVELNVEEGMRVRRDQVLARIDPDEIEAQLEVAEVSLEEARLAYERAKVSHENELISQEAFDQTKSRLDAAKAQIRSTEIQLGYTTIRAPFDGLIIERVIKSAEFVNNGARLFRISDFDPLLCPIQVPEKDLSRLRLGQTAYLEVESFPQDRFAAKVLRISPVVDAASGTIRVTLEVAGKGKLRPGMFASVFVETDVHEDALVVPRVALVLESVGDSVYVFEDDVARRREVTLGFEEEGDVEILSGLAEGDQVLVVGQDSVSDGTAIYVLSERSADGVRVTRATPPPAGASADGYSGATAGASGDAAAGSGGPGGMSPEMLDRIRERLRGQGLSDEQIEERIRQRMGGAAPAAGPADAGGAVQAPPSDSAAPARDPEDAAAIGGPSAERMERMRSMMKEQGLSDEEIEERIRQRRASGRPGGPGGGPPGFDPSNFGPEQIERMRQMMKERGLSDEEIDARIERMRERMGREDG